MMRELYFLTYFDEKKDKNIFVGPHVFYDKDEYAPNTGFFAAHEAENCIDMAKKARFGTFGGAQHFAVVKLRPNQIYDRTMAFYQMPGSIWSKICVGKLTGTKG
jgi:hypothetical protein